MTRKQARYQTIAYEIAKRVVAYQLEVGDKLRGRSMLASEFNVSSETVRKAMRLLANLGVVEVKKRSGIYVISRRAAEMYVDQYRKQNESHLLFTDTLDLLEESERTHRLMKEHVKRLLETSKNDVFPFDFFTIRLEEDDAHLGETLKDLKFWNQTYGLVLAIEADGQLYQAPNPKMPLESGMVLYVLGDDTVEARTREIFKGAENTAQ